MQKKNSDNKSSDSRENRKEQSSSSNSSVEFGKEISPKSKDSSSKK